MSKSEKVEVHVHLPIPDHDEVSDGLRRITKRLHESGAVADARGFGFGGEFGYGADFENDVFEMHWDRQHPTCDCGGSMPKHKKTCHTVTKRRKWLDTRNNIGMVPAYPGTDDPWLKGWMTNTPTTYDEQDAWMKANPFPKCSCGEERAWRIAHPGIEPNDDGFEDPHPKDFEHARDCDWSVLYRPNFTHKPSGSTITWYKYIGRDTKVNLKAKWSTIERACLRSLPARKPRPRGRR